MKTIRLIVFGQEVWRIEFDFGEPALIQHQPIHKAVKGISRLWVRGMVA